ncbi:MAG: SRPBCC domain-containing protein [Phycisphaerae bacterium]
MSRITIGLLAAAFVLPHALPAESFAAPPAADDRAIRKECIVEATRHDVFKAFTTEAGVTTFFAPQARVELRVGGPYEIYFNPAAAYGQRGAEGCRVLAFVPDEMLAFTWGAPQNWPEIRWQRTYVVLQFADAAEPMSQVGAPRTRVTVYHAGWQFGQQWDEVYAYFEKAWSHVLENLQKRFTSGPLWPTSAPAAAAAPSETYCYFIHPVSRQAVEKPDAKQRAALAGHVAYIKSLLAGGRLIVAGPAFAPTQYPSGDMKKLEFATPGIVIFTATDAADAKRIMEGDPAVQAGVFEACVNPFRLAFSRQ